MAPGDGFPREYFVSQHLSAITNIALKYTSEGLSLLLNGAEVPVERAVSSESAVSGECAVLGESAVSGECVGLGESALSIQALPDSIRGDLSDEMDAFISRLLKQSAEWVRANMS